MSQCQQTPEPGNDANHRGLLLCGPLLRRADTHPYTNYSRTWRRQQGLGDPMEWCRYWLALRTATVSLLSTHMATCFGHHSTAPNTRNRPFPILSGATSLWTAVAAGYVQISSLLKRSGHIRTGVDKQAAALTEEEKLMMSFGSFHLTLRKLRDLGWRLPRNPTFKPPHFPLYGSLTEVPLLECCLTVLPAWVYRPSVLFSLTVFLTLTGTSSQDRGTVLSLNLTASALSFPSQSERLTQILGGLSMY